MRSRYAKIRVSERPTKRVRVATENFYKAGNPRFDGEALTVVPAKRELKVRALNDPREDQIQRAVIKWWHYACHGYGLPEFALAHFANGGKRGKVEAARLKGQGVRRGMPDLLLSVKTERYSGLAMELKTRTGTTTPEQKAVLRHMSEQGFDVSVQHDVDGAIGRIKGYLTGVRP